MRRAENMMTASNVGFRSKTVRSLAAIAGACLALGFAVGACGHAPGSQWDGGGTFAPSSSGGGGDAGIDAPFSPGNGTPPTGDGGSPFIGCLTCPDATIDAGVDTGPPPPPIPMAIGSVGTPDCVGCSFPGASAMPCPASAPAIKIVYPNDNVLLPPNMNVISVHFTPFGAPFSKFSVDFSNTPNTDWHIVTACKNQTIDAQSGMPSGGCEVVLDPVSWSRLVTANRGGGPVTITVRGTTDGTCATASTNQINMSFAEEDLLGTYYYWQSLISPNGIGGQIYKKTFGDLSNPEVLVTPSPQTLNATCNGCHSLSRDGTRMVVYSDDNDSDDEYDDIAGSYLDMTMNPATEFPGGITFAGWTGGGQPPGFSTVDPTVTKATSPTAPGYYITSNGYPCPGAGGFAAAPQGCGRTSTGYPVVIPPNAWSLWNGTTGAFAGSATIGPAGTPTTPDRPTMPDWSPDGQQIVYVVPTGEVNWIGQQGLRHDDDHMYGGSLYTVPYTGMGTFGAPSLLLATNGENNYYPSYSPDVPMSYVIFNRADAQGTKGTCGAINTPLYGFCPDDSFSNPNARLLLLPAPASMGGPADGGAPDASGAAPDAGASAAGPIDLEKANGSPLTAKVPLSNSYPRWAPFVQHYHGNKILWFTFSSTRDYGARVINQNASPNTPTLKKTTMHQCYPSDSPQLAPNTSHHIIFAPDCQEPQLWMAPLYFGEASGKKDPSGPAFWVPYQKIDTHNHTAQWTQQYVPPPPPPPDAGIPVCSCQMNVYQPCGAANGGCDCCAGTGLVCTGSNTCFAPPH